jgi:hypothetical protein
MSDQTQVLDSPTPAPRPTGRERKYRYQTIVSIEQDQVQWDVADAYRRNYRSGGVKLTLAEIQQQDLETRVRLAYLESAAGSVPEWERSRTQIVAEYLRQKVSND